MHFKNLTFNDLPTVVGELCKRIESLETVLKNSLAVQNKVKENHHVPMTVVMNWTNGLRPEERYRFH